MADSSKRPPLPWRYPYQEDGPRLGSVVLRPVVPITIVGVEAAPGQAEVGFLSHWRPTWQALLGQSGFLDQFTVTFSRMAQHLAVEEPATFDRRFGVPLAR